MALCTSPCGFLLFHSSPGNPKLGAGLILSTSTTTWKPLSAPNSSRSRLAISCSSSSDTEDLRLAIDENPEGIISGEWPDNFSLLSYDDLSAYLETQILSTDKSKPTAALGEAMSKPVRTATPEQTLAEIEHHFGVVSGIPVVDGERRCVGVVSKKDVARAVNGLESKVGEFMSSPAITLSPEKTVLDAAALMLKMKIHRIPITNEQEQVVGIVTRTDIFQALEAQKI
ncbi:CBS domain-containing protein CBSX1, chloroplastic-like [Typha latifolia]|uniref:CBS domain-containing protein CBSX1, chloroplastic-like n=1 Tax=Typha latifolia TaxID=4733 RepID=UPI003C30DFC8